MDFARCKSDVCRVQLAREMLTYANECE